MPDPWTLSILARLRARRRSLGVKGMDLAERLGVTQGAVSRIELGRRRMSIEHLEAWLTALGLDGVLVFHVGDALDDDSREILQAVAEGLPHAPSPARRGLLAKARAWRGLVG